MESCAAAAEEYILRKKIERALDASRRPAHTEVAEILTLRRKDAAAPPQVLLPSGAGDWNWQAPPAGWSGRVELSSTDSSTHALIRAFADGAQVYEYRAATHVSCLVEVTYGGVKYEWWGKPLPTASPAKGPKRACSPTTGWTVVLRDPQRVWK